MPEQDTENPRELRAVFPPLGLAIEGPTLASTAVNKHDEIVLYTVSNVPITLTRGAARIVAELLNAAAGPQGGPAMPWALQRRGPDRRWEPHEP